MTPVTDEQLLPGGGRGAAAPGRSRPCRLPRAGGSPLGGPFRLRGSCPDRGVPPPDHGAPGAAATARSAVPAKPRTGHPRCRAREHPARLGLGRPRRGRGDRPAGRWADRRHRRHRHHGFRELIRLGRRRIAAAAGRQAGGGPSSSGRLIRSNQSPGASTSDGVGRLRSEDHSLARPSSPARSTTPAMNDRPRSTWV